MLAAAKAWRGITDRSTAAPGRGRIILLLLLPPFVLLDLASIPYVQYVVEPPLGAPELRLEAGALAFAVPALLAGLAMAAIYRRGFWTAVLNRELFSRTLILAVNPFSGAIFGLLVSLQIRGLGGGAASAGALVPALSVSLGGLGVVLGASGAATTWDFKSPEGWARAVVVSGRRSWLTLLGLAVAIAALRFL